MLVAYATDWMVAVMFLLLFVAVKPLLYDRALCLYLLASIWYKLIAKLVCGNSSYHAKDGIDPNGNAKRGNGRLTRIKEGPSS